MLTEILSKTKNGTYQCLVKWIHKGFNKDLVPLAIKTINLKEDYERGLFVRLGFQAIDKRWENSLDAMAAIELLDSSLLIVDDIVDDAPRRMERDTLHKASGLGNAIIIANILKSTSILAIAQSAKINKQSFDKFFKLLSFYENTYNDMYFGEYLDLYYEKKDFDDITVAQYIEMIKRTTGVHFGIAMRIGSMLANGNTKQTKVLWDIGTRLGTILQIRDDFIDYIDEESMIHKPAFGDFTRQKKRLPLILAYKYFPQKVKTLQNSTLDRSTKCELLTLVSHPQIKVDVVTIINNIYKDTDILIDAIKTPMVQGTLKDFSNLVKQI